MVQDLVKVRKELGEEVGEDIKGMIGEYKVDEEGEKEKMEEKKEKKEKKVRLRSGERRETRRGGGGLNFRMFLRMRGCLVFVIEERS